jgi:hypothetical protein
METIHIIWLSMVIKHQWQDTKHPMPGKVPGTVAARATSRRPVRHRTVAGHRWVTVEGMPLVLDNHRYAIIPYNIPI